MYTIIIAFGKQNLSENRIEFEVSHIDRNLGQCQELDKTSLITPNIF